MSGGLLDSVTSVAGKAANASLNNAPRPSRRMDLAPLHAHADAATPAGPPWLVFGALLVLLAAAGWGLWAYVRHRFPA